MCHFTLQGYCEKRAFIIAQSPMENTVRDFWKMVVDYKVPAVVMLCDVEEEGVVSHLETLQNNYIWFVN